MFTEEQVGNLVMELVEASRKFGWRQAGGGLGCDEAEAQVKFAAKALGYVTRELLRDAGRYKSLRDSSDFEAAEWVDVSPSVRRRDVRRGAELDSALDAAIAASQGQEGGHG